MGHFTRVNHVPFYYQLYSAPSSTLSSASSTQSSTSSSSTFSVHWYWRLSLASPCTMCLDCTLCIRPQLQVQQQEQSLQQISRLQSKENWRDEQRLVVATMLTQLLHL